MHVVSRSGYCEENKGAALERHPPLEELGMCLFCHLGPGEIPPRPPSSLSVIRILAWEEDAAPSALLPFDLMLSVSLHKEGK